MKCSASKSGLFHGRLDFIKHKLLISEECKVPLYSHYHTLIMFICRMNSTSFFIKECSDNEYTLLFG